MAGTWQRLAERLARYGWLVLLVAAVLAVVGSIVYAAAWQPQPDVARAEAAACANPPCFGGDGMPGVRDLPVVIPVLGYLLVIVLGVPSLLAGAWDLLRGRWAAGGRRLLMFVGPLLVLIGIEVIPHLLSPCTLAWATGGRLPGLCEERVDGVDIVDRWHPLLHTLTGTLPLVGLYGLALRRWHPAILRFR